MRNRSNYGIVGNQITANLGVGGVYSATDVQLLISSGNWVGPPSAPVIGTATSGFLSALVTFTAPVNAGGAPITNYTVTSSPGNFTSTGSASPITVSGLTTGTAYTFTVTATNEFGTGPASSASNSAIPSLYIDYLLVAGGGGGGGSNGGGGGAGGLIQAETVGINSGVTYTVTIGAGGTVVSGYSVNASNGSNSLIYGAGFTTVTAIGGGGGASETSGIQAGSGGSGGGGNGYALNNSRLNGYGASGPPRQGYDGGLSPGRNSEYTSGGGGGAGAVGNNPSLDGLTAGSGGIGVQWPSGSGTYYAGGGGGAGISITAAGGLGGGGTNGGTGSVNTGGGGGGARNAQSGGAGGSGVSIIRVPLAVTASATTGSPTVTTDATYRFYKFTQSGTITF